jgi:predicted lipoprotein with Yx(FWY)xxD motif
MNTRQLIAVAASAVAAWAALAGPVNESHDILVDKSGRTLYLFDKDQPGKSNCRDVCSSVWPAFLAEAGAQPSGEFSLIDSEGGKQWAYKNHPLYFYAGDEKSGDRNGDRIGGVWHVIPASRQTQRERWESGFTSGHGY